MIKASHITKIFKVHEKEAGLWASVRSLVVRRWIEKVALYQVSLKVQEGEILGLVGANGAGKTTLVKILSGIMHPTSGDASVLGHVPWERKSEFRRQISLIMGQKAQLWWDLPAADCFLLLRDIFQIPKPLYTKNLDYLVESLGVKDLLKIQIRRLSLGERMKMELIAALLHQPRVVFLDEPTIGLDITAQRNLRRFILNYSKEFKPAIVLTSHYMDDIEELCNRITVIKLGEFVYDGLLRDLIDRYAPKKVITAYLPEGSFSELLIRQQLPEGTDLIECNNGSIKVRAERSLIPETVSRLLQAVPVNDLSVQEEDISVLIEAIMTGRRTP